MKWYHYLMAFGAGLFLANAVPHFTHGISGESFTTPFAEHPGLSHSPPLVNVVWAGVNMVIGCILLQASKVSVRNRASLIVLFAGIMAMSMLLSTQFGKPVW